MKKPTAALLIVLARSATAAPSSEDGPPIVIVVEPAAARLAPARLLRKAIDDDVGPVILGPPDRRPRAEVRGFLFVTVDRTGRILVRYRDRDGNTIERDIAPADDQTETVDRVALLAGNLVRNEAGELLAELGRGTEQPSPLPSRDPTPIGIAPADPRLASRLDLPVLEATVASPRQRRRSEDRVTSHHYRLGTLAYVSSRSSAQVYTPGAGLFVSRTISRDLSIGVTDLLATPNAGQTVVSGGPFLEAVWLSRGPLELLGQAGVPIQVRWGGARDPAFGAQPFLGGGLRVWIGDRLSIAVAARVAVVATGAYESPPTELVRGTVSPSGGLEIGYSP